MSIQTPARLKLITPIFRVSYPWVFKPAPPMKNQPVDPNKPAKYSVCAVWTPGEFTPAEKELWSKIQQQANKVCMEVWKKGYRELPAHFKKPFRDGAEREGKGGFGAGKIFASLSSHMKPQIVGPDGRTPILDLNEFYPGCYARASVSFFTFQNNPNSGLSIGLSNLKKVREGERLDSRTSADTDFADLGEADLDVTDQFSAGTTGDDFL